MPHGTQIILNPIKNTVSVLVFFTMTLKMIIMKYLLVLPVAQW